MHQKRVKNKNKKRGFRPTQYATHTHQKTPRQLRHLDKRARVYTNCACVIVLGILLAQARPTMPCICLVLYCMFAMPNRIIYLIYASAVRVQPYLSASYLPCLCSAVSAARRALLFRVRSNLFSLSCDGFRVLLEVFRISMFTTSTKTTLKSVYKAGQTEFTAYRHHPHRFFDFHYKFKISKFSPMDILCHVVEPNMPEQLVATCPLRSPATTAAYSSVVSGDGGP